MEPIEGYSFFSNPEMSAEQKRQKKLHQINTWAWEIIQNFQTDETPGQASRPATSLEDYEKGIKGRINIIDMVTTFVIDYATADPFHMEDPTIQRFILTDIEEDLQLSATPPLVDRTTQELLSRQMVEDEFLSIVNAEHDFIQENLRPASDTEVERLFDLLEFGRFGDIHLDPEYINQLLPGSEESA